MKISIIGHNACGKSTLATKIADEFTIPRLELDRLWFTHGGNETTRHQVEQRKLISDSIHTDVSNFLAQNERWVSDGFYSKEQPAISDLADQVVFIDIPLWQRQWNHLKRIWNRSERHPELSIWDELFFTYDMIRRTKERTPQIAAFYNTYKNKLIHLRSHQEVDTYFESLEK